MMRQQIGKALSRAQKQIERLDAQLLLAHVLDVTREHLLAHDERRLSLLQSLRFSRLVQKRKQHTPLAYLVGQKAFYGLDFFVNKNVLVPRPETEDLVEYVLQKIENLKGEKMLLVDIGTGSGCIPISIVKTHKHSNIQTLAIDVSKTALKIAKKNAQKHGVNIQFLKGNLLKPILKQSDHLSISPFDHVFVTANLPYVPAADYKQQPSIQKEPPLALLAGSDGMDLYREFIPQLLKLKDLTSASVSCIMEMDPSQIVPLSALFKNKPEVIKDLSGRERFLFVTL
ncbi:peptide chain release factor N(5)-glutamine methyltransferase [Candidatus Nomurabacteria bacterium]|nr:peptide chain release factor N(5)-glutamine methyltransferase [Candidatus Nomurabacteria bacterium]